MGILPRDIIFVLFPRPGVHVTMHYRSQEAKKPSTNAGFIPACLGPYWQSNDKGEEIPDRLYKWAGSVVYVASSILVKKPSWPLWKPHPSTSPVSLIDQRELLHPLRVNEKGSIDLSRLSVGSATFVDAENASEALVPTKLFHVIASIDLSVEFQIGRVAFIFG